ncbi:MAG: uroporphyrinogen-III synthase [Alphaproteobacteria bacterium]
MRVLVTRPAPDAELTVQRLRALGHEVYAQPLMQAEFLTPPHSSDPGAIMVTSRNGVRALSAWPQSAEWRDRPLFAVGDATAALAAEGGFTNVRSARGDGNALAALVIEARDPRDGPILYPAAEERSSSLETRLRAGGFKVDTAIAYRMRAAKGFAPEILGALESGLLEGVLLYSKRSASIFLSLIDRDGLADGLRKLRVFAMSDSVANVFSGRAVERVDIAQSPQEEVVFSLLPTPVKVLNSNQD